jgi:hypothetical protein
MSVKLLELCSVMSDGDLPKRDQSITFSVFNFNKLTIDSKATSSRSKDGVRDVQSL